ncbi:hypothetical protein CANTEDRAFT_115613 [Yamadazyma tenuis ATCC 10573]|uniref:p-loop containing nucleoside triphosphate hydrolase protein n=2 Tax=Candida tenuis TaxID=2315449 RepID=G3BB58_CANTC|nr:P-loop containing nucleoside triphosphate hydrolase protein [Yamadazyma tenuis ATCC 10573]XP_006688971.1 uncharacterized protein CANTEDRAFT_115613 [Yamadazyma tenuis ATCC 10573]EGV62800.1 P-loop containing nucleoside triphosphate hydrolase protein [Yamadazyma tenuis ATCC 10573]EGV62801.1 hypothetical protein CANTEDRAFT_115613 [Yamadazyma tenuis ATCC 10573]
MTFAIETNHLSYKFPKATSYGIEDVTLQIPWGTTNLVVGPNGAGKSTLLRILAGKTLIKQGHLKLGGFDPFEFSIDRNAKRNSDINSYITYLGIEWASNPVVKREMPVNLLISSIGGDTYTDRRDELIRILDIDPEWLMSNISDGERRRVQLVIGLLKPWKLLLLDEVTVDLDVIARDNLLKFLKKEVSERQACVVYATHIYDGLNQAWCDRLIHFNKGSVKDDIAMDKIQFEDVQKLRVLNGGYTVPISRSFHPLVSHWLAEDLESRGSRAEDRDQMAKRHNDWSNKRDGSYFDGKDNDIASYFKSTRS